MVTAPTRVRRIRPGGRVRLVLTVLAVGFALVGGLGLAAHFWTAGRSMILGITAIAPYLMLGSVVALVLALIARQWVGVVVAAVLLGGCVSTQARLYVASPVPANTRDVVVLSSNLYLGQGDAQALVNEVRAHHVELLSLQEISFEEVRRLSAAGLDELLPYHESHPDQYGVGTGLWSRYPVSDAQRVPGFGLALVTVSVAVPGIAQPTTFAAVHMSGPVPDAAQWGRDIAKLPSVLRSFPDAGSVIVGGDFNATPDTVQFRRLLRGGYRDGADQAGAGLTRSWPSNRWYPPMLAIDHVLTRDAVARSVQTIQLPGTDHRALLSVVAVPRG